MQNLEHVWVEPVLYRPFLQKQTVKILNRGET